MSRGREYRDRKPDEVIANALGGIAEISLAAATGLITLEALSSTTPWVALISGLATFGFLVNGLPRIFNPDAPVRVRRS